MTRSRFLTGSLASIAVASAVTLAAPAANAADDRGCGQPAVDAVYSTVVHDPVFRTVPAQSHQEWTWERDVDTVSYEFTQLISPAGVETDWSRTVPGAVEYQFVRKIVDVPGVPAVPGTPEVGHFETVVTTPAVEVQEWEYLHQNTGKTRWESESWGAQNGQGNGWAKTGETRQVVLVPAVTTTIWVIDVPATPGTPAVEPVTHKEYLWAAANPGGDWRGPIDERIGAGTTENETTDGEAPAGEGWALVATRTVAAVYDTVWAASAPEGYDPTGASKVVGSTHELSDSSSAQAPEGEGWTQVADSAVTVVDVPASEVLVSEGYTEQVLLSPALPATEPCVEPPTQEPTQEPTSSTEGPQAAPAVETSTAGTVLPATGNDVAPWMAPTGFAVMLAGIAVIRFSRRPGVR